MGYAPPMSSEPQTFSNDLRTRGRQNRSQRVGNPFTYLASVGIEAVLEEMYRGANLVDTAEVLDVSVSTLRTWLDKEGHWARVEEATTLSAEGYLSLGQRLLKTADTKFELDKAKALVDHARWMASKLDKAVYGTTDTPAQATTVSYVFNVGGDAQIVAGTPAPRELPDLDPTSLYRLPVTFEVVGQQPSDVAPAPIGPFTNDPDPREQMLLADWLSAEETA